MSGKNKHILNTIGVFVHCWDATYGFSLYFINRVTDSHVRPEESKQFVRALKNDFP